MSYFDSINLKKELKTLFSQVEDYRLKSIYDETLRGQLGRWRSININKKSNHLRPKKLYSKLHNKNKKCKKYVFFIPNILDYLCPENIAEENFKLSVTNLEKFFDVLCKNKNICLKKEHIIILYLTWEKIGRWRSIEKEILIEELAQKTKFEKSHIKILLNELWKGGFLVDFSEFYGIKDKIKI